MLRKRYTRRQLLSVGVVTLGLILTAKPKHPAASAASAAGASASGGASAAALLGIVCMCGALLARALSGALQEKALREKGCVQASELLFFRNALALPILLLRYETVSRHADRWLGDSVGGYEWPRIWLLLLANLIFDYACKLLMTRLIAVAGALHATLVLTMQKFASFFISIFLLDPQQGTSPLLVVGALCVLLGTTSYATSPKCDK